jgi:2,3-bisphosphoglycerate-dependent phosphoglycerate mutase
MKKYCILYLVRHGETGWNARKLIQGTTNVPLNKKGEEQAKALGRKLSDVVFNAVYSSDLIRAKRTAEIITLEKKLAIVTTKALRERYYSGFEGKSYTKYYKEIIELLKAYRSAKIDKKNLKGVETDDDMMGRLIPFLRELSVGYIGKTVLLLSHGGIMRTFLIHLGFGNHETLPPGSIANLAYVKLKSDGVDFFVEKTEGIKIKKG